MFQPKPPNIDFVMTDIPAQVSKELEVLYRMRRLRGQIWPQRHWNLYITFLESFLVTATLTVLKMLFSSGLF